MFLQTLVDPWISLSVDFLYSLPIHLMLPESHSKEEDAAETISKRVETGHEACPGRWQRWRRALGDDWKSVLLLLFLYTLQGIPISLMAVIPLVLQERKSVSYSDQAVFSFSAWPYR